MRHSSSRTSADRHGNALSRSTLEQTDDTHPMQQIQANGFSNESMGDIEHVHPYGFSARPQVPDMVGGIKRAAEAFMSFLGGNRSHGVVVAVGDRRFRLFNLQPGEVGLHDDQGHQIHITRGGVFVSAPNSKKIVGQIMSDNVMPQNPPQGSSTANFGQIPQAGRSAVATFQIDANSFSVNHPGTINLTAPTVNVTASTVVNITSPTTNVKGDLHVTGAVIAGSGSGDQVGLQTHTHPDPQGGNTTAPNAGT